MNHTGRQALLEDLEGFASDQNVEKKKRFHITSSEIEDMLISSVK